MSDVVNRGAAPNDSAADSLYDAFGKVNEKFGQVDTEVGNTASTISGHEANHPPPTNRDARNEAAFSKNTAFNKNFGSAADTVCQGNDARLSDAREWTAQTVSQLDAEAGTATTRRAWTAQRVRQAIAAWWNGVSIAISKVTGLQTALDSKEPSFSKNTGFNKNFGSAAGTVCQGDDARLSDARTPTQHGDEAHSENYIKEGDSRLSDARTPTSHNLASHSDVTGKTNSRTSTSSTLLLEARAMNDHRTSADHDSRYEQNLNADQKRKITYGTADPSGGSDGDIYMQYV